MNAINDPITTAPNAPLTPNPILTRTTPKINFDKWRPSDQKVYISDISKIKKVLGWSPKISIDEGINKVLGWTRESLSFFK